MLENCGKGSKCWLPAFSPIPSMFSDDLFPHACQKLLLCGKRLLDTLLMIFAYLKMEINTCI